jgi:hypothetical protein
VQTQVPHDHKSPLEQLRTEKASGANSSTDDALLVCRSPPPLILLLASFEQNTRSLGIPPKQNLQRKRHAQHTVVGAKCMLNAAL